MIEHRVAQIGFSLVTAMLNSSAHAESTDLKKQLNSLYEATSKIKAASIFLQGEQIYENHCLPCHTPASPLPPIAQSPLLRESSSQLARFILFSKNGSDHPAWHVMFSPKDVANLSTYMEFQFKQSNSELVSPEQVVSVIAEKYRADHDCAPPKAKQ